MKAQVVEQVTVAQAKTAIAQTAALYFAKDANGRYRIDRRRARPVCLMGPAGIGKTEVVRQVAEEQGLDLVKISPNAVPPVCKIMDYSKFCFDQKKREKEAKKNQRVVEVKEIRMSPSIDTNDLNTKVKAAQKFLQDGNRVKVSVRFRGREMAHTNLGEKLLMDFADACAEIASMEKNPKLEGRFMAMFLAPKNGK